MSKLTKRKRLVIQALADLGGTATTRQIADRVELNINGVSQTLGSVGIDTAFGTGEGKGGDYKWQLAHPELRYINGVAQEI